VAGATIGISKLPFTTRLVGARCRRGLFACAQVYSRLQQDVALWPIRSCTSAAGLFLPS
jgi:hypothetical protein